MLSASRFLESVPLILAAVYYLLAPFFTGLVRRGLIDYLEKVDSEWRGSNSPLPPHRTSEALAANIDWVIDAPQMVPSLLLPLTAAVFAMHDNDLAGAILAFSTVGICAAALWIYSRSPLEYRSLRFIGSRYTLVSALGVILNLTGAGLILLR